MAFFAMQVSNYSSTFLQFYYQIITCLYIEYCEYCRNTALKIPLSWRGACMPLQPPIADRGSSHLARRHRMLLNTDKLLLTANSVLIAENFLS
jgi:hypothetical protein